MPVTTGIIIFFVGNPDKPSFTTVTVTVKGIYDSFRFFKLFILGLGMPFFGSVENDVKWNKMNKSWGKPFPRLIIMRRKANVCWIHISC